MSMPIRLSKQGLPLSVQLITKKLREPQLLAVAKYIESKASFKMAKPR